MKKSVVIILLLIISGIGIAGFLYQEGFFNRFFFDTEGRYDPTILDDMGVLYSNRSDIESFNEGYSESDNCPWGFDHNGIDYFYFNNSDVVAAAPGLVESIELRDWGLETWHRYTIAVSIIFNATVTLTYGFEPITNSTQDQAQQLAMFNIEKGTWVQKGDVIGKFLRVNDGAHIHFGVYQNEVARDPTLYMSTADYNELLAMVHDFHPTWDISYP
ncbi:M23 family metallopeptidase [Candidatus Thorarchaeota archaeon]|nr:M23 family metallopeptidase [Candidatus Thorarchaeota archaeon]TFG97693.1 MAG: M23 family metallopeptidase [Candidatus Thorarchaeota archaeon]